MFYLMTNSAHFIYSYMVLDMINDYLDREETCSHHIMGYSHI